MVHGDDSAFAEGRGCYTTVRIRAGKPRFADRHARRLQRGARALALGELELCRVARALEDLGRAAFSDGEGIVRLQASRDARGVLHLVGVPRTLGHEPSEWTAIVASVVHPGAPLAGGHKLSSRLALALAADAAREAGAQEALLLDGDRKVVEGTRSNVFIAGADGTLWTPPLSRGPVDGVGRQIVLERETGVSQRDLSEAELRGASEIVAVSCVRGAAPVTALDGRAVGDGCPGPWSRRLAEILDED